MPSAYSLYGLNIILIVSVYVYMNINCFGQFFVVSSWLRMARWRRIVLVAWFRMFSDGSEWF